MISKWYNRYYRNKKSNPGLSGFLARKKAIMKKEIMEALEARNDRSTWDKAVTTYAMELVEELETEEVTKEKLLNGARDWSSYSYGGLSLIYDCDIAERACTPSELKKKKGGELQPNSNVTWLDVQARALLQACNRIMKITRRAEREA